MHTIKLSMQIKETHSRKRFKYTMYRNWNMKYAHIIWRADVVLWRSTFIVFFFPLNAKSALSVLKMTAWSADGCCEDDYVYIYQALPHVTLHSIYRTLVTSCYKENGGMMKMLVPLIAHPNCCIELRGADDNKYVLVTNRSSNCRTTLDAIGAKTRLKMLRRCSGS